MENTKCCFQENGNRFPVLNSIYTFNSNSSSQTQNKSTVRTPSLNNNWIFLHNKIIRNMKYAMNVNILYRQRPSRSCQLYIINILKIIVPKYWQENKGVYFLLSSQDPKTVNTLKYPHSVNKIPWQNTIIPPLPSPPPPGPGDVLQPRHGSIFYLFQIR